MLKICLGWDFIKVNATITFPDSFIIIQPGFHRKKKDE